MLCWVSKPITSNEGALHLLALSTPVSGAHGLKDRKFQSPDNVSVRRKGAQRDPMRWKCLIALI